MAGALLERQLTPPRRPQIEFDVATRADDDGIRRLLRETAMAGAISISMEREPDYFANDTLPGHEKQTIVARAEGRIVCAGSCVVQRRFVNGEPRQVGYLGGLRLDERCSGRFDIVRRGYEFFRQQQTNAPADFYFTSIAADNVRARKILERGLPGMPRYEFVDELVTALIPAAGAKPLPERDVPMDDAVALLQQHCTERQFAPLWTAEEIRALRRLGLQSTDFAGVFDGGKLVACASLWDQRNFKQTVVRGYANWLKLARPFLNCFGGALPGIGKPLSFACVSHFSAREMQMDLLSQLRAAASARGIKLLAFGCAANDPCLPMLRRHFRLREYRTRIYVVRWPGIGGAASELDSRILAPEIALL